MEEPPFLPKRLQISYGSTARNLDFRTVTCKTDLNFVEMKKFGN